MSGVLNRLINVGLRGSTLVSKFLLIFILARLLDPAEVGLYGLVTATVGYALFFFGLDFYTFTTRELIKTDKSSWGTLLKSQCSLSLLLYAIFLPLLTLLFLYGVLPWRLAPWVFVLLILEHINQELSRLLVAISRPLVASWVMFLRSGIWAFAIAGIMYWREDARDLTIVLQAWAAGGLLATVLGVTVLGRMKIGGWASSTDWRWIGKGLVVALPFLAATLALRGIYTADRFWLEALSGLEILGVYVLFTGIGNALLSFLDAGVFAFIYPALVRTWHEQSPSAFRKQLKRLLMQTLGLCIAFAAAATLLLPVLLAWLDKAEYREHSYLFPWVLAATVLFALSMIPHYALYALGKDRPIVTGHIAALLIFIASTWLLSGIQQTLAVPQALCMAFGSLLLWKVVAYVALTPISYQLFRREA